ncbi:MAG: HNH endonuclease [Alphaproteobacteria bacterium]|nr:HNH endonuclease [Alphaproteobacteria bacterium]
MQRLYHIVLSVAKAEFAPGPGRLREQPEPTMPKLKTMASRVNKLDTRTAPLPAKTCDPFYLSREWRVLVAKIRRERGDACEDANCKGPHYPGQRIYADHIVEISDGGAKLDPRNVLLRCSRSHGLKTARERVKRQRA